MTTRKPADVDFPGWVEQQIRQATADGAFDNLPGAGRPIPDLGTPRPELAWVASYLRRENVEVTGLLPPALALAKEVEDLPVRLLAESREAAARHVVDTLNARIAEAHAAPQDGPPFRVKLVDADAAIARWRAGRDELVRLRAEAPAAVVEEQPIRSQRSNRWLRRSRPVPPARPTRDQDAR